MTVKRVVVTGAAGSLGERVLPLLERSEAEEVVAIDKTTPAPAGGVEWRSLDLDGPDGLEEALAGADTILHLAWVVAEGDAGAVNQRILRRVLDAADRSSLERLIHISSATVYGAWPDNPLPLTEERQIRPNPEMAFAADKAEAERVVADWAADNSDVAVAVLRPAVVVGGADRPLYRILGDTSMPGATGSTRPVQFVHVDDLATAVVLAADRSLRGVYNVAPDVGTAEDTARALSGGVAQVTLPRRVSGEFSRLAWRLARKGAPPAAQAYNRHAWVIASDRLKSVGWVPKFTSEEALVAADDRSHWDDLPPGRRQEFTLLVGAGAGVALAGAASAVAVALRRRRR